MSLAHSTVVILRSSSGSGLATRRPPRPKARAIKLPLAALETSDAGLPTEVVLTQFFPILMKRRGVELRLVVENRNGPARSVYLTLEHGACQRYVTAARYLDLPAGISSVTGVLGRMSFCEDDESILLMALAVLGRRAGSRESEIDCVCDFV
jgi:hypothetical protein